MIRKSVIFLTDVCIIACSKSSPVCLCIRTLWSIFETHAGTSGALLQSQIRPLLNTIGLFPTHSQSL